MANILNGINSACLIFLGFSLFVLAQYSVVKLYDEESYLWLGSLIFAGVYALVYWYKAEATPHAKTNPHLYRENRNQM